MTLKIRKNAGEWQQSEEETKIRMRSKKEEAKKAGNAASGESFRQKRKAEKEKI